MKTKFGFLFLIVFLGIFNRMAAQSTDVLLPVKVDQKWGYINLNGEMIIEPRFDIAEEFKGKAIGRAVFHDKLVLINRKGEMLAEPKLKQMKILNDSIYAGSNDNVKWGIYKLPFTEIIGPRYTNVQATGLPEYFFIYENSNIGLIDFRGKILIEPNFEKIMLQGNYFETFSNKYYGVYNLSGKEILPAKCNAVVKTNFRYLFFEFNSRWGCIAFSGDTILKPEFRKLQEVSNYYIKVTDKVENLYAIRSGKMVFTDFKGGFSYFTDSLIRLMNDKLSGVGNEKGEVIIAPEYNVIYLLGQDYFIQKHDSVGIYSAYNVERVPIIYKTITILDDRYFLALRNETEALYSITGKLLIREGNYSITASENRIRVKSRDKIEVYKVDDNFAIQKDDEFINVITVSVLKRVAYRQLTQNNPIITPTVVAAGGWFLNEKNKYGKVNVNGDTIVPPVYDAFQEFKQKDMALVYLRHDEGIKLEISGFKYSYNRYVGLIQNSTGKVYVKPEFCFIDIGSIQDSNFVTTRAINKQGMFCFIFNGRKPITRKICFIDTASNGVMRFCEEGFLTLNPVVPSKANFLCLLGELYSLMGVSSRINNELYTNKVYIEGGKWGFWSVKGRLQILPQYQFVSAMYGNRSIIKQHNKFGLIDEHNNTILKAEYYKIELLSRNDYGNFKVWRENGNYGYINKKGEMVVTPVYSKLSAFREGYCVGICNGNSRFLDSTGAIITDFSYQKANNYNEGIASVKTANKWGFVNKKGEWVIPSKYSGAGSFGDGLAPICIRGCWGYINLKDTLKIKTNYSFGGDFAEGLARVRNRKGNYGFINPTGNYVIRPTYAYATDFDCYGLARVRRMFGTSYFIHRNGSKANYFRFYKAWGFSEERNILSRFGNYAIMDTMGKIVKRFKNISRIYPYKNGYAIVVKNRKYGVIDRDGNYVIYPAYKYLSEVNEKGLMVFSNGHNKGVINLRGRIILEARYPIVGGCENNVLLMRDGKGGFIYTDIKGIPIIDTHFQYAKPFSDGISKVCVNNNWALMNQNGILITNPKYNGIKKVNPSLYKVGVDYFYGIVDTSGNFIIQPDYDYVGLTNDNVFRVENGDEVGYISRTGKWIWKTRN